MMRVSGCGCRPHDFSKRHRPLSSSSSRCSIGGQILGRSMPRTMHMFLTL